MIFSSTHTNKEAKRLTNDLLGHPFSIYQSIKLGGIGSKRMLIEKTSHQLAHLMNKVADINYGNIELRPNGIIVMINRGLDNYQWVIPYRQLVLYKTEAFSIHAQGKFISFKKNKAYKENKKFIQKMIQLKTENQEKYSIPTYG